MSCQRPMALLLAVLGCACHQGSDCAPLFAARNPPSAIGIIGLPLNVTLNQPRGVCGVDPERVRARVTLVTPDNQLREGKSEVSPYNPNSGMTSVDVHFTPDAPGAWQIIATFEPSLGRVQIPVEVARSQLSTPRHSVELPVYPRYCQHQPWRTRSGLVLCELERQVYAVREGGGVSTFAGEQVMVLGDTVWFSSGTTLTRATDTGTELRVDARIETPARPLPVSGFTSERTAVRAYEALKDAAIRYDFVDGGLSSIILGSNTTDQPDFIVADGGLWRTSGSSFGGELCEPGGVGCRSMEGHIVVHDQGLLVVQNLRGALELQRPGSSQAQSPELMVVTPWTLVPPNPKRLLSEREKPVLTDLDHDVSVMLDGAFTPTYFGPGQILGTRGDSAVLHQSEKSTVTFVDL